MTLEEWNALTLDDAAQSILPCNGSTAWAKAMSAARPFASVSDCFAAADRTWAGLTEADWEEAFDSHPRIGESKAKAATQSSLAMSAGEQSAAQLDDEKKRQLAQANAEYEKCFGHIFIVCATGRTATEMLAILQRRLRNDAATELLEAAEQQRQITRLRLIKWLGDEPEEA